MGSLPVSKREQGEEVNVKKEQLEANDGEQAQAYRIRIPRFVTDEDLGLGDALKRVTSSMGIKTCGGCQRRAALLNHWLVLSGGRSSSK